MPRGSDTVKRKLMRALLATTLAVLAVTCSVFIAYEYVTFRKSIVRGLATRGEIIAANSTAALAFQNEADARSVLSALGVDPHMMGACLYDRDGRVFARYPADAPPASFPAVPRLEGSPFEDGHVVVFLPVVQQGRRLGTVYLKSDLSAMNERFRLYAVVVAFVVAGSLAVAFAVASRLQNRISEPILDLARTARTVSEQKDYGLRARKLSDDEIGQLTDSFNDMLGEIQERDTALRKTEGEVRKLNVELEQRVAERTKQLEEARGQLASVLDSVGEGVVVADRDGKFILFNPAAEQILGMGATAAEPAKWSETYGAFLPDMVTPLPAEDQPLVRAIRGESSDEVDLFIRNPQVPAGVSISVSGRPIREADGAIRGGVVVFRDVTERKRSEEALKESEERVNLALESAQMGAWDLDLVHDTAVRSLRHDQIFGYPSLRPEWSSEIFLAHVLPEDRELVKEKFQQAFVTGQFDMDCRILWPDQSVHWIAAQGHVYYNEKREPARMMGVIRDVSERKRVEQVLAERSAQLEVANKELESFAYSVSHDLRAPLRSIDGFSQVLVEDFADRLGTDGRGPLLRIRAATQRMGQLIDDLLKLSRVSRGEILRERVDLSSLARRTAEEAQQREPERSVELAVAEGVFAEGDPRLLGVVFENLIGNAFKFTAKRPDPRIEFGVDQDGGQPVYFVRDNGAGFDMAYAGKLFGAFQRLHSATEFQGTGIGLATVARIIHRHGGRVWAEGALDRGATFRFTL